MQVEELIATSSERRRLPDPPMLRLLRLHARLSQEEIAGAVGVSRVSISRYETGARRPRGDVLARYLAVLGRLAAPS